MYIQRVQNGNRKGIQIREPSGSVPVEEVPFKSKKLEIEKRGNEIILREEPVGMERAFYLLRELANLEALKNRKDDKPQKGKGL